MLLSRNKKKNTRRKCNSQQYKLEWMCVFGTANGKKSGKELGEFEGSRQKEYYGMSAWIGGISLSTTQTMPAKIMKCIQKKKCLNEWTNAEMKCKVVKMRLNQKGN